MIGARNIRHASQFTKAPTADDVRLNRAMGMLNSFTHPIWMIGSAILIVSNNARWVLPLIVFVIGAHFVPMAAILRRRIDYLLGPIAMLCALVAGVLAAQPSIDWLIVYATAGVGGALSTATYAAYMSRSYRLLCARAGVNTR